ncbi:MAG: hypothetical protein AAB594_02985 [Patescibacteria group bacterium]
MKLEASFKSDNSLPTSFRPLLWSWRWKDIDTQRDKEEIIVSVINEGSLDHWRWIVKTYGKSEIKKILEKRLVSEFHPESRNLAKVLFSFSKFRHARRIAH